MKKMMIPMILVLAVAGFNVHAETSCVPVIEMVQDHVWEPDGPVSVCVLPGEGARTFLAGGEEVSATLRFPVIDLAGVPVPFMPVTVEWWQGGPAVICDSFTAELTTDAEGWVSLFPDIRGGGHCGPDETATVVLWIPVCPNQQLDLLDGVYFNSPDISGDLQVNLTDVALFAADFFAGYDYRSDFNWDGQINLSDVVVMSQSVGSACD